MIDITITGEFSFYISPEEEEAIRLIKLATEAKKTDIEMAIQLIRNAIALYPEGGYYYKLTSYLCDNQKHQEAIDILLGFLFKWNYDEFHINKNMARSSIYYRLSLCEEKRKAYFKYLYYDLLSLFNSFLGLSIQGRRSEVEGRFKNGPLDIGPKTKLYRNMAKINIDQLEFSKKITLYFEQLKPLYITMCDIHDHVSVYVDNLRQNYEHKPEDTVDNLLPQNSHFTLAYNKVREEDFISFLSQILPESSNFKEH